MNNATISSYGIYQNVALSSLLIVEYVKTYQEEIKKEVEFERLFVVLPFCYTEVLVNHSNGKSNKIKGLINLIEENKIIFQSLPLQVSELFTDLTKTIQVGTNLNILEFDPENLSVRYLKTNKKFSSTNKEVMELIKASRKLAKWVSKLTDVEYVSFFNLR
ncbi:hypothetical protein SAMN05660841_04072 [Sphingobacterium nematocida]|uniref:Uncharacterized protein n=1 Tax=Sphingobacterium nematocida TaxID=1513896 RepID=A0A1T5GHN5_9SPHI|nr:three component ABC system middle component [Sphingobacterium nematocida]SKC07933.1 hypothetical protein SAMN05660841_04072 [Sphingobacterium nematocida]